VQSTQALNQHDVFTILALRAGEAAVDPVLKQAATRVARLQALIATPACVLWFVAAGPQAALGAAVGGGIAVLLTVYVAARLLSYPASDDPQDVLAAMIRAEVGKLILATGLVTVAIILLPQQAAAIATTLAISLSAYWFALLRTND